jgi:hypothetical protein
LYAAFVRGQDLKNPKNRKILPIGKLKKPPILVSHNTFCTDYHYALYCFECQNNFIDMKIEKENRVDMATNSHF